MNRERHTSIWRMVWLSLVTAAAIALPTGAALPSVERRHSEIFALVPTTAESMYRGKHSEWVARLLSRTGGYSCPDSTGEGGRPPRVTAQQCMRDSYVAAAVTYAWAAECYARNEEDNKAQEAASQMYENLKSAQGLCSDAPTFGFGGPPTPCDTERIYRCGELRY